MRATGVVALAVLVALAGCSAAVSTVLEDPGAPGVDTPTRAPAGAETAGTAGGETPTPADDARRSGTSTPPPIRTDPVVGSSDNPWGEATLTVGVENTANRSRDVAPLVREALAFWNAGENAAHADYRVGFELVPNATDPDVEVRFVPDVSRCRANADRTLGCAPVVTNDTTPNRPAVVEIAAGYTDASTVETMKHEFGHVLGIEHGEPPAVMNHTMQAVALPEPDASERTNPWRRETLRVHVDLSGVAASDRDVHRDQVDHALAYFDRGADGTVPENVSFRYVENASSADVRVTFPAESPCGSGDQSCGTTTGVDTDVDDALEYHTGLDVQVVGIDREAVGWHVGYWLANGFGDSGTDLPPPFRDADYEDRRSAWWE